MKHFKVLLIIILANNSVWGQCKQKWLRYNHSQKDTIFVTQDISPSAFIDISGKKIRKAFLDSVITFLEANENRKKSNNAMYSDNKIFHHGYIEVVFAHCNQPLA